MKFLPYASHRFSRGVFFCVLLIAVITPAVAASSGSVRFAAIGDYGWDGTGERQVADLIANWNVDFIITQGDNNYEEGGAETIDQNIGKYYHEYIGDYMGSYGPGSTINRFFPALGNHDWRTVNADGLPQPYLDYFTLPAGPGNERYYRYTKGPVEFFVLDSDGREPDGNTFNSVQGQWLKNALANSTAEWKIVYMHHSPYSSERSSPNNGSRPLLQWPYDTWGADAVISAHDHVYQRLKAGDIPYFVNGLGGKGIRPLWPSLPETVVQYNGNYGAMLITADAESITFEFYYVDDAEVPVDSLTLKKDNSSPSSIVRAQIVSSVDDAEESANGVVSLDSSDLELVDERSNQIVGLRFSGVDIPQGAEIVNAYIQFAADEISTAAADLILVGQASDDATEFSGSSHDISSRPKTQKQIDWNPVEWSDVSSAGVHQRTPNIASIIQEITDQPGWNRGQSLAIVISGSGKRTAVSFDGDSTGAPLLYVEYNQPQPVNEAPVIAAVGDQKGAVNTLITFSVSATDSDGPVPLVLAASNLPAGASFAVSGDGSGFFSWMPTEKDIGKYSITFTATDKGGLSDTKVVNVTVILDDHGDTCEAATAIEPNSTTSGVIDTKGDIDYAVVVIPDKGTLSLSTNGNIDIKGALKDSSGAVLATDDNSGVQNNFSIKHSVDAGTYCIRIEGNDEATEGSYGELVSSFIPAATANIAVFDLSAPNDDLQIFFGDVTKNTFTDHIVTVKNSGNANLDLGDIAVARPLFEPFVVTDDACSGQAVLPNESCTFTIRFEPTNAGTFSGVLDIPSNDPDDSPVIVKVYGNGVVQLPMAKITVTGSTVPVGELQVVFGEVAEQVSSDQTVMIANDGAANLVIGNIAQANSLDAPFEILTDNCSTQVLAPAAKCKVVVRFTPMRAGETFEDTFDIPSSDSNERTLTIRVKGTAVENTSNGGSSGGGSVNPLYVVLFLMLFLLRAVSRPESKTRSG